MILNNQNQLMKAKDSTVSMKQLKSIQLEEGKEAIVRTFISSKGYYAIAYLACEKGVVKFNLFSKRKKSFEESIKALIELVKSYEKIDKSVIIRD